MNDSGRDLLIAWSLLPFLSPARTRLLLEYFDPPSRATRASVATLAGLLSLDEAQAELVKHPATSAVAELREQCITLVDDDYPPLLASIIDPPLALYCRGNRALLQLPSVAIVGSRRASPYGMNAADYLARELAHCGLVIVSGLALGIDAAAHTAALNAPGPTIAVLGTGIDVAYPRSNARLFRRIESEGLIVTEFPPSTPPLKPNFPVRNRVISGLTHGTVIVEATSRSGSLITARTAAEQGREVFAVPGSIFAPGSEGTHRLVQYGAKLVHDVDDILHELPADVVTKRDSSSTSKKDTEPDSPLREVLAAFQRDDATTVDDAAAHLGRNVPQLAEALLQLELGGWLRALPGARYVRVK